MSDTQAKHGTRVCGASVEALRAIVEQLPGCLGTWIDGSGGHCRYAADCDKIATVYEDGALL